jgi:hypothetical protein
MAPVWRRWRIYLQIPAYRAGSSRLEHSDELRPAAGQGLEVKG